jgi:predicted nucleic acid-binding protein
MNNNQIIVADTSCLILLTKINELGILKSVFDKIFITDKIAEEYNQELPNWIEIVNIPFEEYESIAKVIDEGEASAIAMSVKIPNSLLILDDIRARKYALSLDLNIIGTLGVIVKAQKEKKINSAIAIIEKIQQTNFRVSEKLIERIKKEINENL